MEKRRFKRSSDADLPTPGENMAGMLNHGEKTKAEDKPFDQALITAQQQAEAKSLEAKGIQTDRSIQRKRRGKSL